MGNNKRKTGTKTNFKNQITFITIFKYLQLLQLNLAMNSPDRALKRFEVLFMIKVLKWLFTYKQHA